MSSPTSESKFPADGPEFHPYRLDATHETEGVEAEWIEGADLEQASALAGEAERKMRFLVLYGSLRERYVR